jgi:serine/threonine protein kinase
MIAQFFNISSHQSLFERELERFADRLAIDPTADPNTLIRRFPDHRDAIGRLITAASTELSEIPSDSFPPLCENSISPIPKRLGRFRLVERLGAGGMGEVYRGTSDGSPTVDVAIKLIRPELATPAMLDRFAAERSCLAQLQHRNIVRTIDTKAAPSEPPHLAMELISGTSLTEHCRRNELGTRERIELLLQVCSAIEHVHRSGFVHRDITPANVLISDEAGQAVAKLIDFGLAQGRALNPANSRSRRPAATAVLGTLHYMSPEQAGCVHDSIDHRSDLFSLGVVLFELLTQTTPLDEAWAADEPLPQRIAKVRRQRPTRPSDRIRKRSAERATTDEWMRPEFSWARCRETRRLLDAICIKALARDPSHRYSTAQAFAADLRCFLESERFDVPVPGHRRWSWNRTRWQR